MRDETAKDNGQTAALISHDFDAKQQAGFFFYVKSSILPFSNTEIFLSRFRLWCPQRIDMNDILRKVMLNQEDRISRSDTARQRV